MNYFDTSALIKLFVQESNSEKVEEMIEKDPDVFTSIITYSEIYSGLTRKLREKAISALSFSKVTKIFEKNWSSYHKVKLKNEVLTLSRNLICKHPLRAFDALHLACAFQLGNPKETTLVAADAKLLEAAKKEGFCLSKV